MLTIGSLFSGIGGLELGLERAGLGPVLWQAESDEYARKVLKKHWPNVPCYHDVRDIDERTPRVDLICGGFPCQDISFAGGGAGLDGERSGLWGEFLRVIRCLRPRYILLENVAALLVRGIDCVLGDLARSGHDAEWSVVSACSLGTPHVRRRVFIVAYPHGQHGWTGIWDPTARRDGPIQAINRLESARAGWRVRLEDPSALYRGADGVSSGMDRNGRVGNAVVPQVSEWIGRRIIESLK